MQVRVIEVTGEWTLWFRSYDPAVLDSNHTNEVLRASCILYICLLCQKVGLLANVILFTSTLTLHNSLLWPDLISLFEAV